MAEIRIIPTLTVLDGGLYRTIKFKNPKYVGDPINAVKIFNEKEVDELVLLDISPKPRSDEDFSLFKRISCQAFMPLAYGGRISTIQHVHRVFKAGFEKVVINSIVTKNYSLIKEIAEIYGSQSVVVSIDVNKSLFSNKLTTFIDRGRKNTRKSYLDVALKAEACGAGELYIRSIEKDGSMNGYDLNIIKEISDAVSIPIVAVGGAGSLEHMVQAVDSGAHSVAAGSMFVYQGPLRAVLINYPSRDLILSTIHNRKKK